MYLFLFLLKLSYPLNMASMSMQPPILVDRDHEKFLSFEDLSCTTKVLPYMTYHKYIVCCVDKKDLNETNQILVLSINFI